MSSTKDCPDHPPSRSWLSPNVRMICYAMACATLRRTIRHGPGMVCPLATPLRAASPPSGEDTLRGLARQPVLDEVRDDLADDLDVLSLESLGICYFRNVRGREGLVVLYAEMPYTERVGGPLVCGQLWRVIQAAGRDFRVRPSASQPEDASIR